METTTHRVYKIITESYNETSERGENYGVIKIKAFTEDGHIVEHSFFTNDTIENTINANCIKATHKPLQTIGLFE